MHRKITTKVNTRYKQKHTQINSNESTTGFPKQNTDILQPSVTNFYFTFIKHSNI